MDVPIQVIKAAEPGSPEAARSNVILARNEVSERLHNILVRYVRGELNGRSFLIAGHRGSGKTTLVRKVVHDVTNQLRGEGARPLLVVLPGPALLPPEGERRDSGFDETRAILEQITLNLYRALGRHFANQFALRARARPGLLQSRAMERAAEFRLRIDGQMQLSELRRFWSELKAHENGILFDRPREPHREQGEREIAALFSCLRAYLSLAVSKSRSGEFSEKTQSSRQNKTSLEIKGASAEKRALAPLLGIFAAGSTSAVVHATAHDSVLTVLSGLTAAAGSLFAFNYRFSRVHEHSDEVVSNLIIERDCQSLARELPELILRCRDAGLAPVFLVDELDKVQHLNVRMESLVGNAKFFVTEQAVFFFVTDRAYYSDLEKRIRESAYPREHTFFSERIFVTYRPQHWHQYLHDLLVDGPHNTDEQEDETAAVHMLSYILLSRSRMHAIDLHRELSSITSRVDEPRGAADAVVKVSARELLTQLKYRLELLMQIAVELTFALDPELQSRCQEDPLFMQLAYDALYYLAHLWRIDPEAPVILERSGFSEYLESRSEGRSLISDCDAEFLFRKMKGVRFWLSQPRAAAEKVGGLANATGQRLAPRVIDILRDVPSLASGSENNFSWTYDSSGRELNAVHDFSDAQK